MTTRRWLLAAAVVLPLPGRAQHDHAEDRMRDERGDAQQGGMDARG